MRLARPVYESLPLIYVLIGGLAILLFYLDPLGLGGKAAFLIGCWPITAALTLFLRRQDYRALEPRIYRRDDRIAVGSQGLAALRIFGMLRHRGSCEFLTRGTRSSMYMISCWPT